MNAFKVYIFHFTMLDETPGYVYVNVFNNVTTVTIIVCPAKRYRACNKSKQFFGGIAFCNPKDKFDITIGIKEACKNALHINHLYSWDGGVDSNHRRSIYSSIRKTMRGKE